MSGCPHPLALWERGDKNDLLLPLPKGEGWSEGLNHNFHQTKQGLRFPISESARRDILDRLLSLNHARYAEEVKAGLHDKSKGKKKKEKVVQVNKDQYELEI